MTWIATLDESQHPIIGRLAAYRKDTHGYFPNVLQAMTLADCAPRPTGA